jgi:hypothetical protein
VNFEAVVGCTWQQDTIFHVGGSSMRYGIIYGIYQTEFLQEKLNLALNFKNLRNFQKLNEIKPVKLSISTNS